MIIRRILTGIIYSLYILSAMIVNLSTASADVVGTVTSISGKVIQVDGVSYKLPSTVLPMKKTGRDQVKIPTNLKQGQAVLFKESNGTIDHITVLNEEFDKARTLPLRMESHSAK